MKFSIKWLQEYIDLQITPEDLAEKLTFSGIEVESVDYDVFGKNINEVVVAEILTGEPHPYKDNLSVCKINDGQTVKQVICGAPNCHPGLKSAYIPSGAKLGDVTIEKITIKTVESDGMLCSEKDLNLSSSHEGIIELCQDAEPGRLLSDYLDLNDISFDVEITPNRPDLLGLIGIARDIAAILDLKLKDTKPGILTHLPQDKNILDNREPNLCTRYTAVVIKGVEVTESPLWLKKRLKAVGIKPVNTIVDITNYTMMEYGHPLHAFDYDKLAENRIVVRRAIAGEEINALDNKIYKLLDSDLVIADGQKPVAIAGVIGGIDTSITTVESKNCTDRTVSCPYDRIPHPSPIIPHSSPLIPAKAGIHEVPTTNILLEAANFNNTFVRKTAQRLKINTDASYRFERGQADETITMITGRAVELIIQLCGGEVTAYSDSYPTPEKPKRVNLRPDRANKLLSTQMSSETMINYLERLGLKTEVRTEHCSVPTIEFSIPYFRKDLYREIDLIEELIRIHGYNNVGNPKETYTTVLTDKKRFSVKRKVSDFLSFSGYYEAINSSFADKRMLETLELNENDYRLRYVELENPIGSDSSIMRSSLLPALLNNVKFNINNSYEDIRLFELGTVYYFAERSSATAPGCDEHRNPCEKIFLSGVVTGNSRQVHWKYKNNKTDIFIVKGMLESLLSSINEQIELFPADEQPYIQKGQGLVVKIRDIKIGDIGKLDPLLGKQFDLNQPLYLFDIDLETVLTLSEEREPYYKTIVRFPSVERDISFIISREINHSQIQRTIWETDKDLIREVRLIDEFTGKGISEDSHSLTYRITISSKHGTLTDNTIRDLTDKIFSLLSKKYDIQKR